MNQKLKEWLKRYLPSNILSTILILLVRWVTLVLTHDSLLSIYLGMIGGFIGYEGLLLTRDVIQRKKQLNDQGKKYKHIDFLKNIRNLMIELGPGDLLDFFVFSPICLYIFPIILNNFVIGTIVGKYAADILFYIPTIISYELRKKYLKD